MTTILVLGFAVSMAQAAGPGLNKQAAELRTAIKARYGVKLPAMPVPINNPQSPDKIKLGEALFFDPNVKALTGSQVNGPAGGIAPPRRTATPPR